MAVAELPICRVTRDPLDAEALFREVQTPSHGAVCVFYGVVREDSLLGKTVRWLEYEAYPEMAEKKMREIVVDMRARWPEQRVAMAHRIGRLEVGEPSVIIAVASPHRRESFAACSYAIDAVKATVPIWKKEVFADGEKWVG